MKKLVFPLLVGGILCLRGAAQAQDIINLFSPQANTTLTAGSADYVDITFRLYGKFGLYSLGGGSTNLFMPGLAVVVNRMSGKTITGTADFSSISAVDWGGGVYKTDVTFRYNVKPGDMAAPLRVYGWGGTGGTAGAPYTFTWNGWEIRNIDTTSNTVWTVNSDEIEMGQAPEDLNLGAQQVILKTLDLPDGINPTEVAATAYASMHVTTFSATQSAVPLHVWTPDTNLVQIGTVVGQNQQAIQITNNTTETSFLVKGVNPGVARIYVMRELDYVDFSASTNFLLALTNYVTRTIEVTPAPEPAVSIVMTATGTSNYSLNESDTYNLDTSSFTVTLSEKFTNDVYVLVDTFPAAQSNLTFDLTNAPYAWVKVPANSLSSSPRKFNAKDGLSAVELRPTAIVPAAAATKYTGLNSAFVDIQNVKPTVVNPVNAEEYTATRYEPFNFVWDVSDVEADQATLTLYWNFGDGLTNITHGASGSVAHTYNLSTPVGTPRTAKVYAKDKNGAVSDTVTFTVVVKDPDPQPSLRVVPRFAEYAETSSFNSGILDIFLSEPRTETIAIQLAVTLNGGSQNNINLLTNMVYITGTNHVISKFSIPDGTVASEQFGLIVTPTILTAPANTYFTDVQAGLLFVTNVAPVVTKPVARDYSLTPSPIYTNIVSGVPFVFDYKVDDAPGDTNSMIVVWDLGDGTSVTVTGAVGKVTHTYSGNGVSTRFLSVQAFDKDGASSALVEFPITVVPPPPTPFVRVNRPASDLYETMGSSWAGSIGVELSQSFTNDVYIQLDITPPTNAVNGVIKLQTNQVFFAKNGSEGLLKTVNIMAVDGTDLSFLNGFRITPRVIGPPSATNFFTDMRSGLVTVINKAPVIANAYATTTPAQGVPCVFQWTVNDVATDTRTVSVDGMPPMRILWDFGDGRTGVGYGAAGTITNIYTTIGPVRVQIIAVDKDGLASDPQWIDIEVRPTKNVLVTPKGPSGKTYQNLAFPQLGAGRVYSPEAYIPEGTPDGTDYYFTYNPALKSARIRAIPYRYNGYDSFFFVWVADEGLLPVEDYDPRSASSPADTNLVSTILSMKEDSTNAPILKVTAVFSREWRMTDNMGDINQDSIPDLFAFEIERKAAIDTTSTPPGLTDLELFNADFDAAGAVVGDFLPNNPGRLDFRPVGEAFTAKYEVRGFEEGLNAFTNSVDGNIDEPKTDATLADSDGDGYLDGWEYYFYYYAMFGSPLMTGSEYNPNDPSVGTLIPNRRIATAFEPFRTRNAEPSGTVRGVTDLDRDGLSDLEEMVLGTNPCQWDTDSDGVCDGWEVLRGLNPRATADGAANPDADFMAYAEITRYWVTVNGTNYLSNRALAGGANISLSGAQLTTWYHYGTSNDVVAAGYPVTLPLNALAAAPTVPVTTALVHFQVMREFGFDPRTAWINIVNFHDGFDRWPAWLNQAPNTRPFTSKDEYLLAKFMSATRMNGAGAAMNTTGWESYSTDPLTPDSDVTDKDKDGLPDGWELYVSVDPTLNLTVAANRRMVISPWNALDGDEDSEPLTLVSGGWVALQPRDGLPNRREFAGTDSSACYIDPAQYASVIESNKWAGVVSITQPAGDVAWVNKFWPTNPWSHDTDGDGMNDLAERTFFTGSAVDDNSTCVTGGGLNPNSMDTDLDALPDAWEFEFRGGYSIANVVTNGMDGTLGTDFDQDWDSDGLVNYQEYWTQAMRSFRYDITAFGTVNRFGKAGQPMDTTFEPSTLFTEVSNRWDQARYPWGDANAYLYVMLPLVNVYDIENQNYLYASTDPRDYDTDQDGLDDYYEMYHGLNPLLGDLPSDDNSFIVDADRVARACLINGATTIDYDINDWGGTATDPLLLDFVNYPWMTGLPEADPDADGLRNLEEKIQPNTAAPSYSNTDPSPMWFTDDSNTNSATARFYHPMGYTALQAGPPYSFDDAMFYWPPYPVVPPTSVFSYEKNEGYDTDNDGVSDKDEMVDSRNGLSDAQDFDDVVRRQAIWFSGTNSAATSQSGFTFGEWTLRSFTVELWARPEVTNAEQVLLERIIAYAPSDLSLTGKVIRCNFRVGINKDGRVYGMYDNAGAHDDHTTSAKVFGNALTPNAWVHLAVRMDGAKGQLSLLMNGKIISTVATTLMPANGLMLVRSDQGAPDTSLSYTILSGQLTAGAQNIKPAGLGDQAWADYVNFYKGFIDEVRVWDGARTDTEIDGNYQRRFTKSDLFANRVLVRTQETLGHSRVWTNPLQLAPEMLYHFTFDNLFSSDSTNSVATSPRGFNDTEVSINRPSEVTVHWWSDAAVKSTVYSDYQYVPWIENSVSHLPIFGSANLVNGVVQVQLTNTVANSVYWTHAAGGGTAGSFAFPNSNNPYDNASDLLPLGGAYAKQAVDMWDELGASGVWLETGLDEDSDGLPDWWEEVVLGAGNTTALSWSAVDPLTGRTYGEQYQRDIAHGMTENNNPNVGGWTKVDTDGDTVPDTYAPDAGNTVVRQTADADADEIPDWWEDIFGLNGSNLTGSSGARSDPDHDGLSNYAEYLISESPANDPKCYGWYPRMSPQKFSSNGVVSDYYLRSGTLYLGEMFSDHDFMEDSWEDLYGVSYTSRYVYDPLGDADGDGWSNWAECRYRVYAEGTRPDVSMKTEVFNLMDYEFPIPAIETQLRYKGLQSGGNIVVQTFTSASMSGTPDATFTIPNDATTVTAKTQPLGYWADRTVNSRLSPGSIQPGTVSFKFTDLWTGISSTTGFDVDGILYSGAVNGVWTAIGTINYLTGEFQLNLSYYKDRIILLADQIATRDDYIDCNLSYVEMSYSVRAIDSWPKTIYMGRADTGYVREGTNYVFAFMDVDSSGTWTAGEPCGVATPIATDIGWDYNRVAIQLTDYTPSYLRMTLTGVRSEDVFTGSVAAGGTTPVTAAALSTYVRVRRTLVDGLSGYSRTVFEKEIMSPRDYIHEGDLLAQGEYGLDWGMTGVPGGYNKLSLVYEVSVANATVPTNNLVYRTVKTFTNQYDVTRAQAVGKAPIGGEYVNASRPTFKWTMPDGYTAFAIEIKRGSDVGPTVYNSDVVQAPLRTGSQEYQWTAPISEGDVLPTGETFTANTLYAWRVVALNSKYTSLTATPVVWNYFRLNSAVNRAGYGDLRARVKYYGPATANLAGRVKVQVFRNRGFTGEPEAQYTIIAAKLPSLITPADMSTNAVLRGLQLSATAGDYYLRAYIDSNNNGRRDVWESWGYANYFGESDVPYNAKPFKVTAGAATQVAAITIEDADTDNDWIPDAYEYEQHPADPDFLAKFWSAPNVVPPFVPTSVIMPLTAGTSDQDADGVGDLAELILGSSSANASTAGDGFVDGEKLSLGLASSDKLALNITSVSQADMKINWLVSVEKDTTVNRVVLSSVTGVDGTQPVTYVIEYKSSLADSQWTPVKWGEVTLSGTQTLESRIGEQSVIDPAKGFYRVRLIK